jgi:hypothetical protein
MNYIRNLKSAQFSKLFTICQYSLMQNSRISGAMEGICFKLLVLENLKKIKPVGPACQPLCPSGGAQTACSVSGPRHRCYFPPTVSTASPPASTASRGYKRHTPDRGFPLFTSSAFAPPCSFYPSLSATASAHR